MIGWLQMRFNIPQNSNPARRAVLDTPDVFRGTHDIEGPRLMVIAAEAPEADDVIRINKYHPPIRLHRTPKHQTALLFQIGNSQFHVKTAYFFRIRRFISSKHHNRRCFVIRTRHCWRHRTNFVDTAKITGAFCIIRARNLFNCRIFYCDA